MDSVCRGRQVSDAEWEAIGKEMRTLGESAQKTHTEVWNAVRELQREGQRRDALWNEHAFVLAAHGWYLDQDMKLGVVFEILSAIRDDRPAEAIERIAKHYRENLAGLRRRLVQHHVERESLLSEAFEAHAAAKYFSSTILFLSQVEGVGGQGLLSSKKAANRIRKTQSPPIVDAVLGRMSAISAAEGKRAGYASELNRHRVMHGLDCSFGSEENSLKSLSLLCFVSGFVDRYKNRTRVEPKS